ncbi:PREDICTED: sulfotransferase 6B1-like [Crocodylus porosus]|uniref:Sulfotransferase n=1 Tax=Crocodylus porosus TaxID=8502 RepID=A0A7M4G2C4_CROPO|nr:PREDICTED: sulfotransferase 6B1-like [Crocodylus porosus]
MTSNRKALTEKLDRIMALAYNMPPEENVFSYNGVLYPVVLCSPETFEALESFEARSDDVLLAGYPKSGSNWILQILNDLVTADLKKNKEALEERVKYEEKGDYAFFEFGDPGKFERIKKLPFRRVLATHLLPGCLPTSVFKNNAKILMLTRNPKDVAVSYFHFSNGMPLLPSFKTWDEFFSAFMCGEVVWGSYFDYMIEWNKHINNKNIMCTTYEELKENLILGVKKITEFFEFSLTEEELQAVVDRSSFQAMKENSHRTHGTFGNILFRKGAIGDWKTLFTETQNQEMERKFEECLAETKLGVKIKYKEYCKA